MATTLSQSKNPLDINYCIYNNKRGKAVALEPLRHSECQLMHVALVSF